MTMNKPAYACKTEHWFLRTLLVMLLLLPVPRVMAAIDMKELSIGKAQAAIRAGDTSCADITRYYLKRIAEFDQATGLNAIVALNPNAVAEAKALDKAFIANGQMDLLHCAVMIIKDNFNTAGLPSTAGSAAMKGFIPTEDATQIQRLKARGAIILAKSNMAEWAFSPRMTISSSFGETRNPYDLEHVPAGSSGGTAAAVAANLGMAGMGTDTGNSIRGPSSHNALVGFRTTLGLTSRAGIVPLYLRNDVGGPMTRTVEDAVRILQATLGADPLDPITLHGAMKLPADLMALLSSNGLRGKRIGVMQQLSNRPHDPAIGALFEAALRDLERLGAVLVRDFTVTDFDELSQNQWCPMFHQDINQFLASWQDLAPVRNLEEIVSAGNYSAYIEEDLRNFLSVVDPTKEGRPCLDHYQDPRRIAYRQAITTAMDQYKVDLLVYPSWNFSPGRIGHPEEYQGDNSQVIAPHTGLPAFTIPMGYANGLPAGLQFTGRLFSEATLIPAVYAYEQGTLHRRPPENF
ncbi:MAG: hypothetical protein KDI36_00595 [Pseudomonadales bacterium]|nr:hypothetical protein [Pseudomonadales bacterium]